MSGPTLDDMQRGELDWWLAFLARNDALARLFAVYGYRYLPYFFEEFDRLGEVVDYGSGPVSAAWIADLSPGVVACDDPLFKRYREAGLIYGECFEVAPDDPPDHYDTALVLNVLDHCDSPLTLLHDVAARLRSGGKALVWVHVDQPPDALHRAVTQGQVEGWLASAGLKMKRQRVHQDYGPVAYMAVAVKP